MAHGTTTRARAPVFTRRVSYVCAASPLLSSLMTAHKLSGSKNLVKTFPSPINHFMYLSAGCRLRSSNGLGTQMTTTPAVAVLPRPSGRTTSSGSSLWAVEPGAIGTRKRCSPLAAGCLSATSDRKVSLQLFTPMSQPGPARLFATLPRGLLCRC